MPEKDLSARLDELLLGALTDGLELRETLEGIFSLTGMATVILDTGGLETMSVPAAGEGQEALRPALRALLERRDGRARDLFRGRAAAFLPGEAGDGPVLCRLLPAGGEPRHILGVAAPPGLPQGVLERTLERLTQLYDYYDRVPAWEPGGYKASYLESGVARELLLGDGDLSRSVFGNLYDLRLLPYAACLRLP